MKTLQFTCIVLAVTIIVLAGTIMYPFPWQESRAPKVIQSIELSRKETLTAVSQEESQVPKAIQSIELSREETPTAGALETKQANLEYDSSSSEGHAPVLIPSKHDFSYLTYYAYSEVPPDTKPADIVLDSLKGIPAGTTIDEIERASEAFGLDFNFMKAVAKIESDFDTKQRTGSYIGLFQLSNNEFTKYGSGNILDARDNAVAAAYKFTTEAILFEMDTHKKPTLSDVYLIHQQGIQGAAEHVSHPDRIAWKSMCATDEGRGKGEKWCKRAIWANALPAFKHIWKVVDNVTSGAFVKMWHERVASFYSRYSEATTK